MPSTSKGVIYMSPNNNILGANVRRLRKNWGMTQKELGKAVFHEETWISKLENGHLTPSPEDCLKLAQHYVVTYQNSKGQIQVTIFVHYTTKFSSV